MFRRLACLLPALAACAPAMAAVMEDRPLAVLMALDKVTARVSTLEIPVGMQTGYKTLRIAVRACRKASPLDTPESSAFLEISEKREGSEPMIIFAGWMFASSPALSAMDHPVYDVWVTDCKGDAEPAAEAPLPEGLSPLNPR